MKNKFLKLVLILSVIILRPVYVNADYSQKTWASTADFQTGTYGNTVDLNGDQIKLKPQTSKEDFQAGTQENVDITSSPGDVKLGNATDCPPNPSFENGTDYDADNWMEEINNQSGFDKVERTNWGHAGNYGGKVNFYIPSAYYNHIFKIIITGSSLNELTSYVVSSDPPFPNWQFVDFDLYAYAGQTIRVNFKGYQKDNPSHYAQMYSENFTCDGGVIRIWFTWLLSDIVINGHNGRNYFFDDISINGYRYTGTFTSQYLDFGSTPTSSGYIIMEHHNPGVGQNIIYQVANSSAPEGEYCSWQEILDGTNIDTVLTTPKRYLKWKATFTTTESFKTPVLRSVWTGGQYISSPYNCGGDIECFGIFEVTDTSNGGSISYWTQTAPDNGGKPGAWEDPKPAIHSNPIISTPLPWIKWGANLFPSSLFQAPLIDKVKINYGSLPYVKNITPRDKSFGVKTDNQIIAEFDRDLKASATQYFTIRAIIDNHGNPISKEVDGSKDYDALNRKLIFTPVSLSKGYVYEAHISTGVEDTVGNHLKSEKVWWFSTVFDCMTSNTITSSNITLSDDVLSSNKSKVEIDAFAFSEDFYIRMNPDPLNNPKEVDMFAFLYANDIAERNGYKKLLNCYSEINAYDGEGKHLTDELNENAKITLFYKDINNDGMVDETDIEENSLSIYWLNEGAKIWEQIESEVDPLNNSVTALVNHFSVYTLMVGIEGAPFIKNCIPLNKSFGVKIDSQIIAEFDRDLKESATQHFAIRAIMDNHGNTISKEIEGAAKHMDCKLIFESVSLSKGYLYEVKISTGVEDTVGNHLKSEKVWCFSTIFDCTTSNTITSTNIILSSIASSDNKSEIEIAPSVFDKDFYIKLNSDPLNNPEEVDKTVLLDANDAAEREGKKLLDYYAEINAYAEEGEHLTNELNKTAKLTLFYKDIDNNGTIDGTDLKENNLSIYCLNEWDRIWEKVESVVDISGNSVTALVKHFSVYTLIWEIEEEEKTEPNIYPDAYPVPFKPNSGLGHTGITFTNLAEEAIIKVYTISGRLVWELYKNDSQNKYLWDVKDKENRDIASGAYIYYIKTGGEKEKGKLVIIR